MLLYKKLLLMTFGTILVFFFLFSEVQPDRLSSGPPNPPSCMYTEDSYPASCQGVTLTTSI